MKSQHAGTQGTGGGTEEVKRKELTSDNDSQGSDAGEGKAKNCVRETSPPAEGPARLKCESLKRGGCSCMMGWEAWGALRRGWEIKTRGTQMENSLLEEISVQLFVHSVLYKMFAVLEKEKGTTTGTQWKATLTPCWYKLTQVIPPHTVRWQRKRQISRRRQWAGQQQPSGLLRSGGGPDEAAPDLWHHVSGLPVRSTG